MSLDLHVTTIINAPIYLDDLSWRLLARTIADATKTMGDHSGVPVTGILFHSEHLELFKKACAGFFDMGITSQDIERNQKSNDRQIVGYMLGATVYTDPTIKNSLIQFTSGWFAEELTLNAV